MKKLIWILTLLLFVGTVIAQQSSNKIQRYGAGGEIAGIGGGGFAYGGTIEYKFISEKELLTKTNVLGGNLLIGATLADGIHLLIGGGYDRNLTYERGQFYVMAKFNTPVVVLYGKLLLSEYKQYKNNYEFGASLFPGQNVVGIGGYYLTDYDCTVIGAKLTFRFGKTNGGSGKKRDDCSICGL